jgi:predicted dehydrogenase
MKITRRQFIKGTIAVGTTCTLGFPKLIRAQGLNEKLQIGFVGTGGQAGSHTRFCFNAGLQCVAFADIDKTHWSGVQGNKGWEDAVGHTDWRKLFEKDAKKLDVIFVAIPDHNHFSVSMTAISMGIHCYTEKPLTWSVREAQLLAQAYAKNPKVVTQMGNQGHAGEGWRKAYEYIKAGAVGDVTEFHTWTNRPIWPQGGERPNWTSPVPDTLDWDAWIGAAPMRPYAGPQEGGAAAATPEGRRGRGGMGGARGPYHPFNWRGFVDFGSGALGDMACHTTDGIYAIMNPGYAASTELVAMNGKVGDQWQKGMISKNTYRAKDVRPGFIAYWYEGVKEDGSRYMPEVPEELKSENRQLPSTGNLIVGTKGKMIVTGDYWNSPMPIPEKRRQELGQPPKLLERSPGHQEEFIMACKGEKPREFSQSNWGYSGPMTANMQLGNLCARAGKKLELDESGKITSDPKINDLAWREPRQGWGPLEMKV